MYIKYLKKLLKRKQPIDMINIEAELSKSGKKYVVIRREGETLGLFSFVMTHLGNINLVRKANKIPIIDMSTNKNMFLTDEELSKGINAWEFFFEQPEKVGLNEIKENDSFYIESISEERPDDTMDFLKDKEKIRYWRNLREKNIRIKEEVAKQIEEEYNSIFPKGEKVLGILCRGTDYKYKRPYKHPVQPSKEMVMRKARKVMKQRGIKYIFLATEDEEIYRFFKKKFGERLLSNDTIRYTKTKDNFLSDINKEMKINAKQKGMEYLTTIVLLSKCNCLIAGRTSGSVSALLFSKGFEYTYFWNLGRYRLPSFRRIIKILLTGE